MHYHYVNGSFIPHLEASISPLDLGVLRGYGVFDYVQLYKGRPFHLMDHLERLKWAADRVGLRFPLSLTAITDLTFDLIKKNQPIDAGIRFIITGGKTKDLLIPCENEANFMILFHPCEPNPETFYTKGMSVITHQMLRMMPSVKTTNYYPAIFAMKKAQELGRNDALYLNNQKKILEGTTSNVFFFNGKKLITSNSKDIVKGITRKVILKMAKDHYDIEYRSLHIDEIESCEEAFLCSSVKDLIPLVKIDEKSVGDGRPGQVTAHLRKIYWEYIRNHIF